MTKITAAITGVSGYVPEYVLTNQELERMVETNDEWITSRTGIKERRILKGENKGTSHMAVPAVIELLRKTNVNLVGYVEGHDIFTPNVDVVVCDGFTGNIVLKCCEGLEVGLRRIIKEEVMRGFWTRLGGWLTKPAMQPAH